MRTRPQPPVCSATVAASNVVNIASSSGTAVSGYRLDSRSVQQDNQERHVKQTETTVRATFGTQCARRTVNLTHVWGLDNQCLSAVLCPSCPGLLNCREPFNNRIVSHTLMVVAMPGPTSAGLARLSLSPSFRDRVPRSKIEQQRGNIANSSLVVSW